MATEENGMKKKCKRCVQTCQYLHLLNFAGRIGRQANPPNLLLFLGDDLDGHENVERIVNTTSNILLIVCLKKKRAFIKNNPARHRCLYTKMTSVENVKKYNLPPWPKKNRYSRDIHEIDPQCDHVISFNIDLDLQRELATRRGHGSRRRRTEARYRTILHDRTVDQPHEVLGCNDFFGQGSTFKSAGFVFSFDQVQDGQQEKKQWTGHAPVPLTSRVSPVQLQRLTHRQPTKETRKTINTRGAASCKQRSFASGGVSPPVEFRAPPQSILNGTASCWFTSFSRKRAYVS